MKKNLLICVLFTQALLLPRPVAAYPVQTQGGGTPEVVSVTFTFNSSCDDCATQSGEAGENRYFIDVPLTNNPSPAKSDPAEDLSMEVKVRSDRLTYSIRFRPGTSPRAVWRNGGRVLQVFFIPQRSAENTTARAASAPHTSVTEDRTVIGARVASDASARPVSTFADLPAAPAALTPSNTAPVTPSAIQPQSFTNPINRDEKGSTAKAEVDMSVPESPAFTVLGLTPQTVVRPTSPRQFATSLLSGVDMSGNFQSGLALDFVPYLLLAGDELTLRGYQTQQVTRLLSRTQVSFATTRGASDDDKSLRAALGFHATLWDRGDPRTDEELMSCLSTFLRTPRRPSQLECELPDNPTAEDREAFRRCQETIEDVREQRARDVQEVREFNNSVSLRCREEARKRNWNKSSWIIAGAPSWISPTGQTKNFRWNGGGFWTSLAYGFEGVAGLQNRSQLILHARYRNREQVPDPDVEGAFFAQDSVFLGARFRHGSPTFNGSFEYTFLRARPVGETFDNAHRLALGFERRIAGDTWFNLSLGGETGRTDGKNNGFVLTSFKWAFSGRKDVSAPE